MNWDVWAFRLVFLAFVGWFAQQMAFRWRLIAAAPQNFRTDDLSQRTDRFITEVIFQSKVIGARPWVGVAHLGVYYGFLAFGLLTAAEAIRGLGIVDLTHNTPFHVYRLLLVPFSLSVFFGIVALGIRRGIMRPAALGKTVSKESILIAFFIATLMLTYLLTFRIPEESVAGRVNWWVHMVIILTFLGLIPNSKHLHLLLSPLTVFFKSPVLGTVENLDFEKEQVGLETVKDLPSKAVLDAITCVECGRCQDNCPAFGTGKLLNPKTLILQNEAALLAGERDRKLVDVYDSGVLWQCTTCGACEQACPGGVEHLPVIIGARRGLVSNGEAAEFLTTTYTNLERRQNIWGLMYDQRTKFVQSAEVEIFDPAKHEYLVWLGCAGAFEADYQKLAADWSKDLTKLFDKVLKLKGHTAQY